jgi:hypothetical protein
MVARRARWLGGLGTSGRTAHRVRELIVESIDLAVSLLAGTSEMNPDLNPLGNTARFILLGITAVAVLAYALDGGNLAVIPIIAVMALLYHASFSGLRRFFEALLSRRDD